MFSESVAEGRETRMPEWLDFFLRQLSLIAVVLVLHTYIGLHIIRRTLIFSDLALDQLAAFGALAALAAWGVELNSAGSYLAAFAAVLAGAFVLAAVRPGSSGVPREAIIGIVYALAVIATIILTDQMDAGDAMLHCVLQGNMAWVSWSLVIITALVYVLLLAVHFAFRRDFVALVERPERVRRPVLWDFFFFLTQGVITVLIVPVAGVFLAYVFLMLPAAVAVMFVGGWGRALAFGWLVGFAGCAIGLTASYHTGWPYGPSLVLSMGLFFVAALVLRSLRRPDRGGVSDVRS